MCSEHNYFILVFVYTHVVTELNKSVVTIEIAKLINAVPNDNCCLQNGHVF